jgi:hypothetical protein
MGESDDRGTIAVSSVTSCGLIPATEAGVHLSRIRPTDDPISTTQLSTMHPEPPLLPGFTIFGFCYVSHLQFDCFFPHSILVVIAHNRMMVVLAL